MHVRPLIAALLALAAALAPIAQPAPAFDMGTLLDTSFWPENGVFEIGQPADYFLLFPPSDYDEYDVDGRYLVRDASGGVVGEAAMRGAGRTDSPNIVEVDTSDPTFPVKGSGDYTFEVEFEGQTVAAIPFTIDEEGGDDPFDTRSMSRLEGPWRTHAYFQHEVNRPEYLLAFNAWVRRDEPGANDGTEVSVRRNGEEIAYGRGSLNGSSQGWVRVSYDLRDPSGRNGNFQGIAPNTPPWTIQDVTPGTYEVVLLTEDGPFRSYTIQGGDGAFVPHVRSDVSVEPRSLFLTPRRMTGQMLRTPVQLYWIGPDTL